MRVARALLSSTHGKSLPVDSIILFSSLLFFLEFSPFTIHNYIASFLLRDTHGLLFHFHTVFVCILILTFSIFNSGSYFSARLIQFQATLADSFLADLDELSDNEAEIPVSI